VKAADKGVGIAAIIMAICCAVLPLAGGAVAGSLAISGSTIGVVAAVALFGLILAFLARRHKRSAC
jgi:hypothetical protein